jgi:hypothetical protein
MANWLKALGKGARGSRIPDDWRSVEEGLFEHTVTFAQRPNIVPDDRIVLYAAGWGAFFAAGTVESYPYEHDDGGPWRWRIDYRPDQSVPALHNGIPLQTLNVDGRDLRVSMRRRSHIRLSDEEYAAALRALAQRNRTLEARNR